MIKVHLWYPQNTALEAPIGSFAGGTVYPFVLIPNAEGEVMRWGHGGIEFIGVRTESGERLPDSYRAFWPGLGVNWLEPHTGRVINDFEFDVHEEGSNPTRTIFMTPRLNESRVYEYWQLMESRPGSYCATGFNCCFAVARSISWGIPSEASATITTYPPWSFAGGYLPNLYSNPYALEDWVEEVNVAVGNSPARSPAAPVR